MLRGCTPSPDLKIILETTILSISRGLPRLREITKTKDDFCRQQMAGTPTVLNQHHSTRKKDAEGYPTSYALRHTRYKYK